MKTLHFIKVNNLSVLHDEIINAIPSLGPVVLPENEPSGVRTPTMRVEGDDGNVWLTVHDGADEAAIAAVVQSHDPTTQPSDPRRDRLDRITELNVIARSDWTTAQMRELIDLLAQELTR